MRYIYTICQHKCRQYFFFVSVNLNVIKKGKIQHIMLAIFPSPIHNNLLKKITSIANINVGNFDHDIVE